MDNRPTFKTDNDEPIRAGGVLFYKKDSLTNQTKFLMQYTLRENRYTKEIKKVYEDIGGKTD
jgi:hypothetical protein